MKFTIEGTQTKNTLVTEEIEAVIEITKKEVQRITDCPSVEDGDSSAWYDYVQEALEGGAVYKIIEKKVIDTKTEQRTRMQSVNDVDWF